MAGEATLRVGELVMHPAHGFCRVAAIERVPVRDGVEDCYVFRMGSATNPIKVLVSIAQAAAAGLRRPMTGRKAEQVLETFQLRATPLEPRSREELDAVSVRLSGQDPLLVATTIRDLVAAGVKGWLGQPDGAFVNHRRSEQAMLTEALGRLVEELAYVQHTSRRTIEDHIRKCLGRTRRRRTPRPPRS